MAKASAHIAPGNEGYFSHNSRQSFSQSQVFFDEDNEISCTKEEAFKRYRSLLEERSDAYRERTKQTLQKKTVTHLSAVVNLEQHHSLEDLEPLVRYIEDELDTKVIQLAIHRDEGKFVNKEDGKVLTSGEQFFCDPASKKLYFDKAYLEEIDMSQWEMEKNYHAHIEFMGLTSDGKSIKRELTTWFFRKLQDETAHILKMERGEKTSPTYTKEQMQEIKAKLKPKKAYENDKAYGTAFIAIAKELGYWKPRPKRKRKDTHEYKADKAKENELNAKALAKQKDLKAEIARLRTQLQAQKAERAEYAALEQLSKDLKEKIKTKELTIKDLETKIKTYEKTIFDKNASIEELETKNRSLAQENTLLKTQKQALEEKIATLPSPDTLEELKTLKNDFEELQNDYWELNEIAYDADHPETVYDEYGIIPQDTVFTFKERYEQSREELAALKEKIDEKDAIINELNEGYDQIENVLFEENKERPVNEIIKEVTITAKIISHVSKYLNIGLEKLRELFKDDVPDKAEVTKDKKPDINSVLSDNPYSTGGGMSP